MKLQLLPTATTPLSHPLCISLFLGTRAMRCLQKVFLTSLSARASHFIRQDVLVLHICIGPGGFYRCKLQTTRWWWSTVLHPFWHRRPTLSGTSQHKLCRSQWMTVDPNNLCTRCTCTHLSLGRKCSWCTVRCYSTVTVGVFRHH